MRKPRKLAGRLALLTGAGVIGGLAMVGPSAAAEMQAAKASAYVIDGTILGQSFVNLFNANADENTPKDSAGASPQIGPIKLEAVASSAEVNLAAGSAAASANVAGVTFGLGNIAGFSLSLDVQSISAKCSINPDGTTTATNNPPIVKLVATSPIPGLSLDIPVDLIDGEVEVGFKGFSLAKVALGQRDNDYSDGVVSADGLKVTVLDVAGIKGGSVTLANATCGPLTPVNDVPVADPAVLGAVGAIGLLGFGGYRVATRRNDAA